MINELIPLRKAAIFSFWITGINIQMKQSGKKWVVFVLAICFAALPVQADLYKWTDKNGNIVYGDQPPENFELKQITGTISSVRTVKVEPFKFDASLISQPKAGQAKTVIMYSTSWCGYCKKAAQHFRRKGIEFTELDIEKSSRAAKQYKQLNGRGVPLILIGKQRMSGFSAPYFDRIYYGKS